MIKKTILVFISIFSAYGIMFIFVKPNMQISQHQFQGNIIKAQNFIYNDSHHSYSNIIIGTSMSRRLVKDSLQDYYNLSFSGQSIYDALYILKHNDRLPKNLFVEMNFALKDEDENFTSSMFNPILYTVKKHVTVLRDGKQPMAITSYLISDLLKKFIEQPARSIVDVSGITNNEIEKKQFFNKMIQLKADSPNVKRNKLNDDKCFNKLKDYVLYFQYKGVNVIFFEMPVNSLLQTQPSAVLIRKNFNKIFVPSKFHYIKQPDCSTYLTEDGVHLTGKEAIKYTSYFKNEADKILNKM